MLFRRVRGHVCGRAPADPASAAPAPRTHPAARAAGGGRDGGRGARGGDGLAGSGPGGGGWLQLPRARHPFRPPRPLAAPAPPAQPVRGPLLEAALS